MHHVAQLNIAKLKFALDDPRISEFVDNLDSINALAEQSNGFIWRLKEESGNATGINFSDDPSIIPNMSVWKKIEDLESFAYKSKHVDFMKKRDRWFEKISKSYMVLWWVQEDHEPSLGEAKEKLQYLDDHGPSPVAFNFKTIFDPSGNQFNRNHAKSY